MSSQISKGILDKNPIILSVPDCSSFASHALHGSVPDCSSFAIRALHGSIEVAWFDSVAVSDFDYDDHYQSVPDDIVVRGGRLSSSRKKQSQKMRNDGLKRKVSSWISKGSLDKKPITPGVPDCFSFANRALHGSIEEAWFD
ncbi:uncharacterized protein G2W53_040143 [Senna tora]|uniref:Uncharacterized protein n=1 Tax=Senna tora TaxID=362788 RepID=A0A834W3C7_9FABA|nr:uncharacterized protein G2W53_040143 [Senna tora]